MHHKFLSKKLIAFVHAAETLVDTWKSEKTATTLCLRLWWHLKVAANGGLLLMQDGKKLFELRLGTMAHGKSWGGGKHGVCDRMGILPFPGHDQRYIFGKAKVVRNPPWFVVAVMRLWLHPRWSRRNSVRYWLTCIAHGSVSENRWWRDKLAPVASARRLLRYAQKRSRAYPPIRKWWIVELCKAFHLSISHIAPQS